MNPEKIGKYIAVCRKKLNLTQEQLAEKINVSNKTISRWENGNSMPDLTLFKPLCDVLKISITDLINGEKIDQDNYQRIIETNIIDTIDYSNNRFIKYKKMLSIIGIVIGLILCLVGNFILDTESHVNTMIFLLGIILLDLGLFSFIKKKIIAKVVFISLITLGCFVISLVSDYILVKYGYRHPMWNYYSYQDSKFIKYETPLYDYYIVNYDNFNIYTYFDKNKDISKVKFSPFNDSNNGIEKLKEVRKDLEKLVISLPLGFAQKSSFENGKLVLSYDSFNDDFLSDNKLNKYYYKQVVIYNSMALYLLRNDIDEITFNLDKEYKTTRNNFENDYPYYEVLKKDVALEYFNEIVTYRLNDYGFVKKIFLLCDVIELNS